jgi:hypothetical protein
VDTLWRARSTPTHLIEWQSFAPTAAPALSRILAGDEARGPIEVDRLILRGSD